MSQTLACLEAEVGLSSRRGRNRVSPPPVTFDDHLAVLVVRYLIPGVGRLGALLGVGIAGARGDWLGAHCRLGRASVESAGVWPSVECFGRQVSSALPDGSNRCIPVGGRSAAALGRASRVVGDPRDGGVFHRTGTCWSGSRRADTQVSDQSSGIWPRPSVGLSGLYGGCDWSRLVGGPYGLWSHRGGGCGHGPVLGAVRSDAICRRRRARRESYRH
jgi:hypothetical protein